MTTIVLNDKTTDRLPEIAVGRASVFEARLIGVPSHLENVQIAFGTPGDATCNACPCDLLSGGEYAVYANGAYFHTVGRAHYHITARTPGGDSAYLGSGPLRIIQSVLNVTEGKVPVIPDDMWVRGSNGLYYRVTADVDEDGVPFMIVDRNGVTK